jgi:hypothetical protein
MEAAINGHNNNPIAMQKRKERLELAKKTKDVEEATKKITSGSAFFNDKVALNSDFIWDHQKKWHHEKEAKERKKRNVLKKLFEKKTSATT